MCNTYEIYVNVKSTVKNADKWESIIMQWIENNKQYLEANGFNDSAYWHNEMANISCLVGAIWKVGGVAISEYTTTKGGGQKDYSRADLYFSIDGIKYLVESKYLRDHETKNVNKNNIESEMEQAVGECKSIKDGYVHNRMALVFAVPTDKVQIKLNDYKYDIQVMLKINGRKNLQYDGKNYNTVYLFGTYVNTMK
ncbi:MAG: hypothetical protein JU82_08530 [Sulfuricurvum sp. MLSB]|uniref:hypothetical protein n=1 Tax=unclassified Sulfuricurvum TaxID=2632390 RepID=UPI0005008AB4|nr:MULTISPECIES: hypothetical protein [unclassified Sulfuricurvum]KFN39072.1 MAG: hypothetical protein JU82_08530 [Sulfuricurvum sp. MLSB]